MDEYTYNKLTGKLYYLKKDSKISNNVYDELYAWARKRRNDTRKRTLLLGILIIAIVLIALLIVDIFKHI